MKKTSFHNKKAFSLVEISIVLLVIGVIVAGITKSSAIYEKYRITTAANLTQGSVVNSIPDLAAWYETSMESSFLQQEAQNYNDLATEETGLGIGSISVWYDNNSNGGANINPVQATKTKRPQFHLDCINKLPCLKFDGSNDSLNIPTNLDLSSSEYSIFVVEQKDSTGSSPFLFLGPANSPSGNDTVSLGYDSLATDIYYGQGDDSNRYSITLSTSEDTPILHSFIAAFDNTLLTAKAAHRLYDNSNKSYLTEWGTPSFTKITSNGALTIGAGLTSSATFYKGSIGEIIIFKRALKAGERKSVEAYLMEKWKLNNGITSVEQEIVY